MKTLFIISLLFLTACSTMLPISPAERCSFVDMKLAGIAMSEGRVNTYNKYNGHTGGTIQSSDLSCVVPQNEIEKCEVNLTKDVATPKQIYNDGIPMQNFLIGTGYYFFVIPGILAKNHYDEKAQQAAILSQQIASQNANRCNPPRNTATTP